MLCRSCLIHFGATCGEVIFNFCPSWAEVGFGTSDQLGRKWVLYSRQVVGKLILKFCPTWAELFFCKFFLEMLLKMPFSSATTWGGENHIFQKIAEDIHQNTVSIGYHVETHLKNTSKLRIKSLVSLATIWERLWTKSISHRLPLEKKIFVQGANVNVFSGGIWR